MRRIRWVGAVAAIALLGVVAAVTLRGGDDSPGPSGSVASAPPGTANLWVDATAGASPARCATACPYSAKAAYGSFAAAADAATSGDVIRVKAGRYGRQGSIGAKDKTLTFVGEDGTTIDSGAGALAYDTLSLDGGVTLDNVDVTGDAPIVQVFGRGNVWKHSRFDQAPDAIRPCNGDEPLLIQDGDAPVGEYTIEGNTLGPDLTIGAFKAYKGEAMAGCPDGYLHLAQVRLGRGARDITFDRVTFEACPEGPEFAGCGSGHLFFTDCCGGTGTPPTDITVRNSRFLGASPFSMQAGTQMSHDARWTFAYNFFATAPIADDGTVTGVTFVGNAGPRQQTCTAGYTWTKNVWQHETGTACGTDALVVGPSFSTTALGVDPEGRPQAGSPLIDAGEPGACKPAAGIDITGKRRPVGPACDAGAYEAG